MRRANESEPRRISRAARLPWRARGAWLLETRIRSHHGGAAAAGQVCTRILTWSPSRSRSASKPSLTISSSSNTCGMIATRSPGRTLRTSAPIVSTTPANRRLRSLARSRHPSSRCASARWWGRPGRWALPRPGLWLPGGRSEAVGQHDLTGALTSPRCQIALRHVNRHQAGARRNVVPRLRGSEHAPTPHHQKRRRT
jgi:hypothetical protein